MLAALFGAGNEMDAFYVAFRIPNLVRDLFAEGAMSAAFVPAFTRQLTLHGRAAAWRLANNVLNALLLATLTLVAAGLVFTGPLVTLYAGDYAGVPGKLELTILLTRVMLPFLAMVAVAAVAMGMLNALHHYFVPALSPAIFNVATIVCALVLVPVMPSFGLPGIMAIAIAVLLGGLGQILVQWPALAREGFRYAPVFDRRDPALRDIVLLMGPGTIGLAATQVNIFVSTLLATSQGTGAVSWLNYAFRLMYLPIGLFGVSIATAVASGRRAARGGRRARARTRDRVARARNDVDDEHAGHPGSAGAGQAHRRAALRARAVHGSGHGGHGGAAAAVRPRADRLFGGADRIADFLRAPAEPDRRRREPCSRSPATSCSACCWWP